MKRRRSNPWPVAAGVFALLIMIAALYFAHNVLPNVATKAQMIAREDRSALDIPASAFAPV